MSNIDEMNNIETIETVEVENVTEAPVVSHGMKLTTAALIGAGTALAGGGLVQLGIWLWKKFGPKKAVEEEPEPQPEPVPVEPARLEGETDEFREFNE